MTSPRHWSDLSPLALTGLATLTLCALHASPATAQTPDCSTISFVNPIYGVGGSAARPLIRSIAVALRGDANPITVVWSDPGACFALDSLVGPSGTPVNITRTARYWDADGTEHQCLHGGAGHAADFGYMAAQPEACVGYEEGIPDTIGNFVGPVTGWAFITHLDSTEDVISAEAVHLAYRFGDDSQADPWDQEAFLFRRNATSAAVMAVSSAVGLPAASFLGTDILSGTMITAVGGATDPSAALGVISVEFAQSERDEVKVLAYQHFGQVAGFWPDSTANGFDKANIRNGRYWLWTNHRFYAPVDPSGIIEHASVARFVAAITGAAESTEAVPNLELIVADGTVPDCAMRVTRGEDYGELASYAPAAPCGCAFDFHATGATTCQACETSATCPNATDVCRHGYCEAW